MARGPARAHAQKDRRRRRSRRAAPRRPACSPTSRPCARAARASGCRSAPRPSPACSRSASSSIQASMSTRFVSRVLDDRGAELRLHRGAARPASAKLVAEHGQARGVLVQDRREQRRLRDLSASATWPRRAGAAGGDHRERDRLGDLRGEREVVAVARAVGVDRGEEDLACARAPRPRGPTRPPSRPVATRPGVRADLAARRVDREDDGLRAEPLGELARSARAGRAPPS